MLINQENFSTEKIESMLFPEIKKQNNLLQILPLCSDTQAQNTEDLLCVKSEKYRNNNLVEESLWIKASQLESLNIVIGKIKEIREVKSIKKRNRELEFLKTKEKIFNKIYDNSDFPKNKRRRAYEHFVLNPNSYKKHIKLDKVSKFLSDVNAHDTKKYIKNLKKELKIIEKKCSDLMLTDYSLKCNVKVNIPSINANFNRFVDILYLQKNEIIKIQKVYKNKSVSELIDVLRQKKLNNEILSEQTRITDIVKYISSNINVDSIDRDIFLNSLEKVLDFYNKEEALDKFIFHTFVLYNKRVKYFSNKQNEVFVERKKYRNRINVEYNGHTFETCFYLKYKDVKDSYVDFVANTKGFISLDEFKSFIKIYNESLIDKKWIKSKKIINETIESRLNGFIEENKENEALLKSEELLELFEKLTSQFLGRQPENRRREINEERLKEIFNGEYESYNSNIKQELVKKLIQIDYKNSFKTARNMNRNFKFIVGKTNSGKTYQAFNELTEHNSGYYLSPLRLLALEGQEEINKRGKACSMITGEEKDIQEDSTFISSTIEMLNTTKEVDCVVIDEIQMLKDEGRGWAWTQAVIGAPAKNVILTGSDEILSLLTKLIEYTGDTLEIVRLERKSPLKLLTEPTSINNIKKGTAIIAFSRKEVLKYKNLLKDRNVSVIYGNLGPDVRKEEARRFRNGESDILIATDAIAMGLNLPIETVLFSTHTKNIRGLTIELDEQLVQQIAGRAGRYGLKNAGYVGALTGKAFKYIKSVMKEEIPEYEGIAPILPNANYLKEIKSILGINDFPEILNAFEKYAVFKNDLFYCTDLSKAIELSEEIKSYSLSIEENLLLSSAPVRENYDDGIFYFKKYISRLVESYYVSTEDAKTVYSPNIQRFKNKDKTNDIYVLKKAEEAMHNLDLYNWFANRYEDVFCDLDGVIEKKNLLNNFIINSLQEQQYNALDKKRKKRK